MARNGSHSLLKQADTRGIANVILSYFM